MNRYGFSRFYRSLSLAILSIFYIGVVFLIPVSMVNAAPVGSDAGNIEINSLGQAGYTLPITVPPGVRGLAPQISLGVTAQGGLNVGGLSTISRCAGSVADFGEAWPVRYLNTDTYCLDGQPLILVDGVYRTKLETFQKIEAVGDSGNGPTSFKVTTRSGSQLYYGNTPNSTSTYGYSSTIVSWAVSSLSDVSGNGLWYVYTNISNTAVPEIALDKIVYGAKHQDQTPADAPVSVTFDYGDASSTDYGYAFGELVQSSQRLDSITTRADNKIARIYKIGYETVPHSNGSRVKTIHECATTTQCYKPSSFTYTGGNVGWGGAGISLPDSLQDAQGRARGVVLDINNDGFNDWIIAVQRERSLNYII